MVANIHRGGTCHRLVQIEAATIAYIIKNPTDNCTGAVEIQDKIQEG